LSHFLECCVRDHAAHSSALQTQLFPAIYSSTLHAMGHIRNKRWPTYTVSRSTLNFRGKLDSVLSLIIISSSNSISTLGHLHSTRSQCHTSSEGSQLSISKRKVSGVEEWNAVMSQHSRVSYARNSVCVVEFVYLTHCSTACGRAKV